jgi:plasmid maintenance system antidote protein VapI
MRLSFAFGTSPDLRMRLQAKYDLQKIEESKEKSSIFNMIKQTSEKELAYA